MVSENDWSFEIHLEKSPKNKTVDTDRAHLRRKTKKTHTKKTDDVFEEG